MLNNKRLEFHIINICNQSCIFCSENHRMEKFAKYPIELFQLKVILLEKRKKGFGHVTFLGGEPTLYKNFLELLKFSKKIGYKIMVISNGFGFQKINNKLLDYIDELSMSIHGHNEKELYLQTGNKFTYSNLLLSINNIKEYNVQKNRDIKYFANIVINKFNYIYILDIIKFIYNTGYPVSQLLISYIAPEGKALDNYKKLSFDFNELKPYLKQIIELCYLYNIKVNFFGIPICILGGVENSNDYYWTERHTIERYETKSGKITLIDIYSPGPSRERTFVEKCDLCEFKKKPCTGIFKKYLEYYDL